MEKSYIIGVDIGGTNTDAVLMDENRSIVHATKMTTTDDICSGFSGAIQELLALSQVRPDAITGVFLGTTHATNAILEKKNLYSCGAIRIASQYPETFPAGSSWPEGLKKMVVAAEETIDGGFECNGDPIAPFSADKARAAIETLLEKKVESLAVTGTFSPLNSSQEYEVAELIKEIAGADFPVSLSCEIGGVGFIERENSCLLNAALKRVMEQGFSELEAKCRQLGFLAPLLITQNDGSLIDLDRAAKYPVLTISAGPTNSFIGGCSLAKLSDAVVVDIGGTSTDVGIIRGGFPIRSLNKSLIGGVPLNFPMPDALSIALGGGSLVHFSEKELQIGPQSVGKRLHALGWSFGGNELTLTDIAFAIGQIDLKEAHQKHSISSRDAQRVLDHIIKAISHLVLQIKGESRDLPVVLVGGGASLLPRDLLGKEYCVPDHFNVANAYGAALAEISGTMDVIVSLQQRESILEDLFEKAKQKAVRQGADASTIRLVDRQIIPYHYTTNQMARVILRVSGKRSLLDPLNRSKSSNQL